MNGEGEDGDDAGGGEGMENLMIFSFKVFGSEKITNWQQFRNIEDDGSQDDGDDIGEEHPAVTPLSNPELVSVGGADCIVTLYRYRDSQEHTGGDGDVAETIAVWGKKGK